MKFAFCIYKYFSHGGLQQDFLRSAEECRDRGHEVNLFSGQWSGSRPQGMKLTLIPLRAFSNHRKYESFGRKLSRHFQKNRFDLVIGFNRMPGLDIFFAGDGCFKAAAERKYGFLSRWIPRHRVITRLERDVFSSDSDTLILYLTSRQYEEYVRHYATPSHRLYHVPPYISSRFMPSRNRETRMETRKLLGFGPEDFLLLFVGSDFRTKGLDRAVRAMASLPPKWRDRTYLLVLGGGRERKIRWMARMLNVQNQLRFQGPRADAPRYFHSADLLLHPSRKEAAGKVLLEALASGLPVLTTASAGYSTHVERSRGGLVLPEPFTQSRLNAALLDKISSNGTLRAFRNQACSYYKRSDFHSGAKHVTDFLETVAKKRNGSTSSTMEMMSIP